MTKKKESIKIGNSQEETIQKEGSESAEVNMTDRSNKRIGPVKNLELPESIDQSMAESGKSIFKSKCMACYKTHKSFIGPPPVGILDRRSAEWVVNMILNP